MRRNPWLAQESVDRAGRSMNFAYDTIQLAQTYMREIEIILLRSIVNNDDTCTNKNYNEGL